MSTLVHSLSFSGKLLRRGFWLYVWEITTSDGIHIYYVGRTGDSSSSNAQSPFNRMGQHLGFNDNSNALRRRLVGMEVAPEECDFRLVAYGPIMGEAAFDEEHERLRDVMAAYEKALAEVLAAAGYKVINTVNCRKPLDSNAFEHIRAEFSAHFPRLSTGQTT
jgi:hypothetical protein